MKILYAIRSISHFTYHESTIRALCNRGANVEVLYDRQWSENYSDQAAQNCAREYKNLKLNFSIRRDDIWRRSLFSTRELRSYVSYIHRDDQSAYYLNRWRNYIPRNIKIIAGVKWIEKLIFSNMTSIVLKRFESIVPPDPKILDYLKGERPDVIVASPINMRFSEEVEYIKAAKEMGIPTVVQVLSWDNLTTKGLFHVTPDIVLAWNKSHATEAVKYHSVPVENVLITGSPFFDKWINRKKYLEEWIEFAERAGLDEKNKYIVYLGSSKNIAEDETWLIRELADYLRNHLNPEINKMNILVRTHPANSERYKNIGEDGIIVWPIYSGVPDTDEAFTDFFNSVIHSVAAVGINTSGMIDAIAMGKPCVSILTERYSSTQKQANHFGHLLDSNALDLVNDAKECVDRIEELLNGDDIRKDDRQSFVKDFIRPRGLHTPAGLVGAAAIELAAEGKTGEEIDKAINESLPEEAPFIIN